MKPSRFGIVTFGSVVAFIVSVGLMIFAPERIWGHYRIDVVIAERTQRVERHGSLYVIDQRCRIGPITLDRLDWRIARQRAGETRRKSLSSGLRSY